ncbi:MAG: hypothetical protein SWO11_23805, partial [Thermodesulfobacteriota bacterium]|nr:hypothetical protein [Thermodesulfobacteriota bacterium]
VNQSFSNHIHAITGNYWARKYRLTKWFSAMLTSSSTLFRRTPRARTRYLTGHREPHNQTAFACAAPGAGQHRD